MYKYDYKKSIRFLFWYGNGFSYHLKQCIHLIIKNSDHLATKKHLIAKIISKIILKQQLYSTIDAEQACFRLALTISTRFAS